MSDNRDLINHLQATSFIESWQNARASKQAADAAELRLFNIRAEQAHREEALEQEEIEREHQESKRQHQNEMVQREKKLAQAKKEKIMEKAREEVDQATWADPGDDLTPGEKVIREEFRLGDICHDLIGSNVLAHMNFVDVHAELGATTDLIEVISSAVKKINPEDNTRLATNRKLRQARLDELIKQEAVRLPGVLADNYDYSELRRAVLAPLPREGVPYYPGTSMPLVDMTPTRKAQILAFSEPPGGYDPPTDYHPLRMPGFKTVVTPTKKAKP